MKISFSPEYLKYLLQAVFVTVLWSSSWVIIKDGLDELPPLYYAGLRYLVGSITLLILLLSSSEYRFEIKNQFWRKFAYLSLYGIVFITLTQGGMFLALSLLPAITSSFLLNLTPFIVLILSIFLLKETPSLLEVLLFILVLVGLIIYFLPLQEDVSLPGILVGVGVLVVNSFSSIIGRAINRESNNSPLVVTGISMTIGTVFLLILAIYIEPFPVISYKSIISILWLGIINTAFAFTLWNHAMRKIKATDMSVINGLMLPQIVILAILFLNEIPLMKEWVGLVIITFSTFVLQLSQARINNSTDNPEL